jgi:NAD(P)-dependent dehydrogenase (short-subunit alcohol dehydrogenase family)
MTPVALVTGGSRGLGPGICHALARAGYAVVINYAGNETAAQETAALIGSSVQTLIVQGDVGKAADRERLIAATLERFDRLDVLVNNAGITSVGRRDILEATKDSWDQVLAVNLEAPFFLSQLAARAMLAMMDQLRSPEIVNISSVSAYSVSTNRGDYCISKAGLAMLTQLFALRLADSGIRVYEVRPGVMETDMTAQAHEKYTKLIAEGMTPIRRWGTAEDVGQAVVALVTGAIPFSTGEVINVDGGFHIRKFPG